MIDNYLLRKWNLTKIEILRHAFAFILERPVMSDDNLDYVVADFVNTSFGKNYVKLLQLRREGQVHHIKELEVNTALTLSTVKDYTIGDNSDIIATDSQKNTVYILAKQHGVSLIACDFLFSIPIQCCT